jgi:type IV secretion system protein VirB10
MLQFARLVSVAILALGAVTPLSAADSSRDFSGRWDLDRNASDLRALSLETYEFLEVEQNTQIHCTAIDASGASIQWTYFLNGGESKYRIGAESMNSVAKWEGDALLVNTLVSGLEDYAVMDRWTLSRDRRQLTIQRQISHGAIHVEGRIVYGHFSMDTGAPPAGPPGPNAAPKPTLAEQPVLVTRPAAPPAPLDFTIPAGTHILLSLTSSISTKNSKEGDRVYLQTAVPVAQDGRIVIPRGSYVQGTVTKTKPAGRLSSKGELYLLFDSMTLPNGVTRDFRARLTSADASKGKVDSDEGKITGDTGKDPHKVAAGAGIGSMGGVIVGGAAGHPITGLGVGAAAGLAAVLLSKNQDVVLPRGTSVEMVLDRELYYTAAELRH